jgi:hypothetical protein
VRSDPIVERCSERCLVVEGSHQGEDSNGNVRPLRKVVSGTDAANWVYRDLATYGADADVLAGTLGDGRRTSAV